MGPVDGQVVLFFHGRPGSRLFCPDLAATDRALQTDNLYSSVMSLGDTVVANADGTISVWFGPQAPADHESNWIQTVPGKSWFPILRLYGPL